MIQSCVILQTCAVQGALPQHVCGQPYLTYVKNCVQQEENEQQASSASAAADMQAEMLLTQQAFHAKQKQYEGVSGLSVVILFRSLFFPSPLSSFASVHCQLSSKQFPKEEIACT